MRSEEIDLLLNVHSLYVIHADLVAAPRTGSFNLHPGPLPEYAGLNAPSWAIYHGESRHTVTVHWMEPGIDTGAIAYETSFEIAEDDTGLSLSARCVREDCPVPAAAGLGCAGPRRHSGDGSRSCAPQVLRRRRAE